MNELAVELVHDAKALGPRLALGLLIFAGFWLAAVLIRRFLTRISHRTDFNTGYILRLAGRTAAIVLIVVGAITALGTVGINVSALVAGLGLTGFALGFALKDVLSNFVAGVLLLLYRPFVLKDHVAVAGLEGVVTEIDLRYTTLEGEGKKYLIPNATLFTNSITIVETGATDRPLFPDPPAS